MKLPELTETLWFPPPTSANEQGIVAFGGDLSPARLKLAYSLGIFPWYEDDLPILWHCPDSRFVLEPCNIHIPKRLAKTIRTHPYEIRWDTAFEEVINQCQQTKRHGQEGTWITSAMKTAYIELYHDGFAHSIEAWQQDTLVGGLYGISMGKLFFGESMFSKVSDASKIAFVALAQRLNQWDFALIDCQVHTNHLERFGAHLMPRHVFLGILQDALTYPTHKGSWTIK